MQGVAASAMAMEFMLKRMALEKAVLTLTLTLCRGSPIHRCGEGSLGMGPCGRNPQISPVWDLETGEGGALGAEMGWGAPRPGREPVWVCACCDLLSFPTLGLL